jgi:hypothetical protein
MPHEVLLLYYSGETGICDKRQTGFRGMIEVLEGDLIFLGQNYHPPCLFSLPVLSILQCPSRLSVVFYKNDFGHISSFFSVFAQV